MILFLGDNMKKFLKITIKTIAVIFAAVLFILISLNIAKPLIYPDYFSMRTPLCKNPGLNDGFICQGIAASEENSVIFVSGYMKDNSASRIYVTDYENNSYYVSLLRGGKPFTGHAGGIAVAKDKFYIASDDTIFSLSVSDILKSDNGGNIEIGNGVKTNNSASFAFANDDYLYVGEFHDGKKYVTNHHYETSDGDYYAIMCRYTHDDLENPDKIYSIRNKVQGMCITDEGEIILSTSYGLKSSVYYVYNESDTVYSGLILDNAPVYLLDNFKYEFKGPAMSEGLDFSNGKVLTLTESASNKYIFGKFFFANKINALELK